MPVPSSYNDITQNRTIRDFVGWVWYDRTFFYPKVDPDRTKVMLRFGSAHYTTKVRDAKYRLHLGDFLRFTIS